MDNAAAIQSSVRGFLIPRLRDEQTGMAGLDREAFDKVRLGFACASCLAEFFHYTVRCPVCGLERDVAADIQETPAPWLERERELAKPAHRTHVARAEDALAHLALSPDVERIPVRKLGPSKWGRK